MPKKEVKNEASLTVAEETALKAIAFVQKKDAIKTLDGQCKELRVPLEAFLGEFGKELPNGSKLAVVTHADMEAHLKGTLRVGKVLLPEAEEILRKNKLEECLETNTVVREDVLESLHAIGKVSDEVLSQLYSLKETYAFSVTLKERNHE
jgi:hypothetical protein